ncbi:toxin-antitoxin system HicB family antitoxin [Apilactobacillus timberlakei]|uniref:toxin-antitoxin system HicB family antitoxin n=1 Tax=Apilactobacillus timberlakei TaxID=2008380 RepID=UPI00112C7FAA|nr:toxin-antitoxin system HicB family antitoxin [Apilactobacillus timberlakei]TPR18030.1 toxin-antitoxin system HicB family antitoxin [Apilactobacillus timberlakei]TPR19832.1 toxin-antitoxin system HicB family antitoxin [Apilactobacillus timberlakei]TPR21370.1 toxin-antitoxin system HicB family antitoxin [Apilactobacillus timberlakei]
MKVTIKLDAMLADQVKKASAIEKSSIEDYITNVLSNHAKTGNFEQRQFVGKQIVGNKMDIKSHLVMMDGIYYRFDLINEKEPTADAKYTVVGNNGNVLYLKK